MMDYRYGMVVIRKTLVRSCSQNSRIKNNMPDLTWDFDPVTVCQAQTTTKSATTKTTTENILLVYPHHLPRLHHQ